MKNITLYISFLLIFISCKKESVANLENLKKTKNINVSLIDDQNFIYSEVLDLKKTADYSTSNKIQTLDLEYKTLQFSIRYLSERAYISVKNENSILIDWQSFRINFTYDSSFSNAENDIHVLLNDDKYSKGYLLFPAYTEQFATYFVYYFENNVFKYVGNYENVNFNKGTFSFDDKTKELFILADKKYTLKKLIESKSLDQFSDEVVKKDIKTLVAFKSSSNTTLNTITLFNKWVNDKYYVPEIQITDSMISYLFHGQCIYTFPIEIVNENEVELIWGFEGSDCVYEVFFDETFGLPKNKMPQKGKPFAKYKVDNGVLKVTYFYEEWLEKYKNKITEGGKPFPFLNHFILKTK